jgi:transcriptional regulator with XRE-family HTH domain
VKTTRTRLGLSLRPFAARLGCSHMTVSLWEEGRRRPSYESMYYLYTHTSSPEVRQMAAALMRVLDPARWQGDVTTKLEGEGGGLEPLK